MGTGPDQADGVGAQAAAVAGPPFTVSSAPVQAQHVMQGLPARWPRSPAPAARCPCLQGLQEGQSRDGRRGTGGQWGPACSPGNGHSKKKEEAGEVMEQSHYRCRGRWVSRARLGWPATGLRGACSYASPA